MFDEQVERALEDLVVRERSVPCKQGSGAFELLDEARVGCPDHHLLGLVRGVGLWWPHGRRGAAGGPSVYDGVVARLRWRGPRADEPL